MWITHIAVLIVNHLVQIDLLDVHSKVRW